MDGGNGGRQTAVMTVSSSLMVAAVIFLFVIMVFVFFLYLYARRYISPALARRASRAAFEFSAEFGLASAAPGCALDADVLQSLPINVYRKSDFKDGGLECAVCLSELAEGEELRLLPNCDHGFHVECIDMWFQSHSTCPLCRSPVGPATSFSDPPDPVEETLAYPEVLFWGSQDEVNARDYAASAGDEEGNSGTSTPGSLSSWHRAPLTKLLSRGKRTSGSSYSPRQSDVEQGTSEMHGGGDEESGAASSSRST